MTTVPQRRAAGDVATFFAVVLIGVSMAWALRAFAEVRLQDGFFVGAGLAGAVALLAFSARRVRGGALIRAAFAVALVAYTFGWASFIAFALLFGD